MRRYRESGQATTELAIMVVAIMFVMAGMLVIGGIGISSIKSLITTRSQAEIRAARATDGDGYAENDVADWSPTRVIYREGHTVQIPFLADDHKRLTTLPVGSGVMTESRFSQAEQNAAVGTLYHFLRLTDMPGLVWPADLLADRSVDLARLVRSSGALAPESEGEDIYLLKDLHDRRAFRQSLMPWLNLRRVDITGWPSSTVAFPAFGER